MNFYIFSDLDGTLLDHNDYSFGNLDSYLDKIKNKVKIIFNTSKTFHEVLNINRRLNINFPFIVENGACIFFPEEYLEKIKINKNYFKYENYYGFKLTNYSSKKIIEKLHVFKRKYNFSFYTELEDKKIVEITNLGISDIKRSKERLFTNPIYWEDTKKNFLNFGMDILSVDKNFSILEGGRFFHIFDNYNKGIALKKFLKIINPFNKFLLTTISLGDSENDLSMLEITDYSCVIKSKKNHFFLKKNMNNYYSKTKAPNGWKESLDFVFKLEKINF